MKEKLMSAINFAIQNNLSEMSCGIKDAIKDKINDKINAKKKKVAESILGIPSEDLEEGLADDLLAIAKKTSPNARIVTTGQKKKEWEDEAAKRKEAAAKSSKEPKTSTKKHGSSPQDLYNEPSVKSGHRYMGDDVEDLDDSSIDEKHMTSSEKSKEKKLKAKYDPSEMKSKMVSQYGPEKGKSVYFATIRKQAMKEDEQLDESRSIMILKQHYNTMPADQFEKQYGHPKHVVASIFGWS